MFAGCWKLLLQTPSKELLLVVHVFFLRTLCTEIQSGNIGKLVLEDFIRPQTLPLCNHFQVGDYVVFPATGNYIQTLEVQLLTLYRDTYSVKTLFSTTIEDDGCDDNPKAMAVYCYWKEPQTLDYKFRINITASWSLNQKLLRLASGSDLSNIKPFPSTHNVTETLTIDDLKVNLTAGATNHISMDRRNFSTIIFCAFGIKPPSEITILDNGNVLASVENHTCVIGRKKPDCTNSYIFTYKEGGDCKGPRSRSLLLEGHPTLISNGTLYDVENPRCSFPWYTFSNSTGVQFCLINYPKPYTITARLDPDLLIVSKESCLVIKTLNNSGILYFIVRGDCNSDLTYRCYVDYTAPPTFNVNGISYDITNPRCSAVIPCDQPSFYVFIFCAKTSLNKFTLTTSLGQQGVSSRGSCIAIRNLHFEGTIHFFINYTSLEPRHHQCRIQHQVCLSKTTQPQPQSRPPFQPQTTGCDKNETSAAAILTVENKTIHLEDRYCFLPITDYNISMRFCISNIQPPYTISYQLDKTGVNTVVTSDQCIFLRHNIDFETMIDEYKFTVTDRCLLTKAYNCSLILFPVEQVNKGSASIFSLLVLAHLFILVYCLTSSHTGGRTPEDEDSTQAAKDSTQVDKDTTIQSSDSDSRPYQGTPVDTSRITPLPSVAPLERESVV